MVKRLGDPCECAVATADRTDGMDVWGIDVPGAIGSDYERPCSPLGDDHGLWAALADGAGCGNECAAGGQVFTVDIKKLMRIDFDECERRVEACPQRGTAGIEEHVAGCGDAGNEVGQIMRGDARWQTP
jgi:hypothetical protein